MYQFFYWLSFQRISFDGYNNSRHFKVSYKDTRTIFLLLTLTRFLDFTLVLEDRNNVLGATYLNFSE